MAPEKNKKASAKKSKTEVSARFTVVRNALSGDAAKALDALPDKSKKDMDAVVKELENQGDSLVTNKVKFVKEAAELANDNETKVKNLVTRFETVHGLLISDELSDERAIYVLQDSLIKSKGDWKVAADALPFASRLEFAHDIASITSDDLPSAKRLMNEGDTIREIAIRHNTESIAALVPAKTKNEAMEKATSIFNNLYAKEPTAVIYGMMTRDEMPVTSKDVKNAVIDLLGEQSEFNIRKHSVAHLLNRTKVIDPANKKNEEIITNLKNISRVLNVSPPKYAPALLRSNMTSAYKIAEVPESDFIKSMRSDLKEEDAKMIYNNAVNVKLRNEYGVMALREAAGGTGVAFIDGDRTEEVRRADITGLTRALGDQVNWETLFGSADFCKCGECNSVYSPSAYFVELLQYLRNNNLDNNGNPGIAGTPLEYLFERRPDLKCLELTCANTNTVLPYVDLVNEVMEGYVVDKIKAFNVDDETSAELLAEPQHTNYRAYCMISKEVFPTTLPYHQPIDATRLYLKFLNTSRHEVIKTFNPLGLVNECDLAKGQQTAKRVAYERSVDAEYLSITEDEYIIITKQDFNSGTNKVKPLHEYYGYDKEADMTSVDESNPTGLTFVKDQLLKRTEVLYKDLVEILKTRFINPTYPQGKALSTLNSMPFTYAYLDSMVDKNETRGRRCEKLIDYLEKTLPNVLNQPLASDVCEVTEKDRIEKEDIRNWVLCHFGKIGKMLVLASPDEKDNCDIERVRLRHLNGTPVNKDEYDRLHRFIRLWKKLGWTIDETDKALMGLGGSPVQQPAPVPDDDCECFNVANHDCPPDPYAGKIFDMTPDFIHQLAAVVKLADKTGLELLKLLTFWTEISTQGEKSLYKRLFLTHNLIGLDPVFKADANGNYLTASAKMSDHREVLMASLNMKAEDIDAIIDLRTLTDALTIENVSVLYRYGLLSRVLGVKIEKFADIEGLFGQPFADATTTLCFLEAWNKMEAADFNFDQLNYILKGRDKNRKLTPRESVTLLLARTLSEGVRLIRDTHVDRNADASDDEVLTKASLLFESKNVLSIMGLVNGTNPYTAINVPKNLVPVGTTFADLYFTELKRVFPGSDKPASFLKDRVAYDQVRGTITVIGQLSNKEKTAVVSLFPVQQWKDAFDDVEKQQKKIFDELLYPIFKNNTALIGPDLNIPLAEEADPANPVGNTAADKRNKFLDTFIPFLRDTLINRFVTETLSSTIGLSKEVTDVLLFEVLESLAVPATEKLAYDFIPLVSTSTPPAQWSGYLIPPSDGLYTFVTTNNAVVVTIDGVDVVFAKQDPTDPNSALINTTPIKLQGGKPMVFKVQGKLSDLKWYNALSTMTEIPASVLVPDGLVSVVREAYTKLHKVSLIVSGFTLGVPEIKYFDSRKTTSEFDMLDFNSLTLKHFKRLADYSSLKKSLPATDVTLVDFFGWTILPGNATAAQLAAKINKLTNWDETKVLSLIDPVNYNLVAKTDFSNGRNLAKLQTALFIADKINADINLLFEWASANGTFWDFYAMAEKIRKVIRARYRQEDWEQAIKPVNDELRENQKKALISHMLVQKELIKWGVIDADSLFEYFLIDVQMDACMETSRTKQAICSVQLFIHRALLGLELDKNGVTFNLNRERWETWMSRQNVWGANRRVFLHPENWIEASLRDEKSPFFKELESELLQKDLNNDTVRDALRTYLNKLDEVSNMRFVGLFAEMYPKPWPEGQKMNVKKIHVFARTKTAPYFFYYRYYMVRDKEWYPWEKIQVDIPSYDATPSTNKMATGENGAYLIPVVWNNRLLIFFPQIIKASKEKVIPAATSFETMAKNNVVDSEPTSYWEVKMAFSEYRGGKWSQKQVSKEGIEVAIKIPIQEMVFVPSFDKTLLLIDIYARSETKYVSRGAFRFHRNNVIIVNGSGGLSFESLFAFHYYHNKAFMLSSLQVDRDSSMNTDLFNREPLAMFNQEEEVMIDLPDDSFSLPDTLGGHGVNSYFNLLTKENGQLVPIDLLGEIELNDLERFFRNNLAVANKDEMFGRPSGENSERFYSELSRPYSEYSWELFFHTPTLIADALSKSQRFQEAMNWYHFVFNPFAAKDGISNSWVFQPFRETNAQNILQNFFNNLTGNAHSGPITKWRDQPFAPHVVARSRPSAYMKWVVMKYIDNLIAWGDYLFRQDTIESINQASQLYILASHILGPKPQVIPKRTKVRPQTYLSLLDRWDAFSNALVEMEVLFPFSGPDPGTSMTPPTEVPSIFGFATGLYFCLPSNPKLNGYWDLVADRLYKIRHCENIEGVFRMLRLWDPPIDPAMLVQAAAQGLNLTGVLNDLNSSLPNYRFTYLIQKSIELCNELKSLGNSLLGIFEKKDGEVLSKMRSKHEGSVLNLVMEVKKRQLEEANEAMKGMEQNRKSPVYKLQHYLKLIGEDLNKIPSMDSDFGELANSIEAPLDSGGLKLIAYEKEEMDRASDAHDWQKATAIVETVASILHLVPMFEAKGSPFGVGAGVAFGGQFLGNAAQAIAKGLQIKSGDLSFQSTSAQRKGGFLRQLQDRIFQANLAGYEIKQIDKQIESQKIRIKIAEQEIVNHQKQIDNNAEIDEFLKSKYTNEELYSWMEGSIKSLHYQVYTLAFDMARKAEKVYRFERGLTNSAFIKFGYWDSSHDGLHAGEHLYLAIKQLEAAYQEKRGHDYEITKHVSLRQLNPLAMMELKEKGTCEFDIPEVLFDMDYPGHYMRRIRSVSISVPCIVGPYVGVNSTLRLLQNKFRFKPIAKDKNEYPEKTEEADDRFSTVNIPITAIAASSGQNESGVFELNFKDERFMPFEGAGAISKWRLELPSDFRQFDYNTITDVIIHIRYTSSEGGERLKKAAADSLKEFLKSVEGLSQRQGLFAVFDLQHDFPNDWYKVATGNTTALRSIDMSKIADRLPVFTRGQSVKLNVTDVLLYSTSNLNKAMVELKYGNSNQDVKFDSGAAIGQLNALAAHDQIGIDKWTLNFPANQAVPENLYLTFRYTIN